MRRFETRELLPHDPADVLALVADVAAYPRFLPWIKATRLWDITPPAGQGPAAFFRAEAIVGYRAFRGRFATEVRVDRDAGQVATHLISGPFRALDCLWTLSSSPSGCLVDVCIDFEFSERLLQSLLEANMDKAVTRLIEAFTSEAERRYAIVA